MTDVVDYDAQEAPFRKWAQMKQEMDKVINKPDPKPTDPLDAKERELEEGRVWVLTQKGK